MIAILGRVLAAVVIFWKAVYTVHCYRKYELSVLLGILVLSSARGP